MANPGNQHCANCIGTLSFPMPLQCSHRNGGKHRTKVLVFVRPSVLYQEFLGKLLADCLLKGVTLEVKFPQQRKRLKLINRPASVGGDLCCEIILVSGAHLTSFHSGTAVST